jgi:hypothetical protein
MADMEFPSGAGARAGMGTEVTSRPTPPAQSTGPEGVTGQAQEAASTASSEGKRMAGVAGDEAQKIVGETKRQVQALMDEARSGLQDQSRTQRDRLVETLGTLGTDLDRMAEQADTGLASELVRNAAQRVRSVTGQLEGREPAELLDDVRDFARRRPGLFLLGALAAGVVAGRVARGAQRAKSPSNDASVDSSADSSTGTPGGVGLPEQRATAYEPMATTTSTTALPETPEAPSVATFPPDRPGSIT